MPKAPRNPRQQPAINIDTIKTPNFAELEKEMVKYWQTDNTFQKSVDNRPKSKQYVFYDGPPFATGMPHYGHLLGSTSKDVVARYWTMKGYRVERVWGWDCHGLPIENMVEGLLEIKNGKKEIEERGIDVFNQACRSEVLRLDKEWEQIIARLGRWVDFAHSYKTMDMSFMESVWWGFAQLDKKGLIYQDKKVILYCPRCATPLSNFEIAMDNSYQTVAETATTYKYPIEGHKDLFILAWSTTPWNKLVTPALAINPDLEYVQVAQHGKHYILARSTLQILDQEPYTVERSWTADQLTKLRFTPHFDFFPDRSAQERVGVIVADPFVTAEEGTGVVTLAVYGEDDYRVMKREGIHMPEHIDAEGKIVAAVQPWAGMYLIDANPLVNQELAARNLIYSDLPNEHAVPVCYRCSTRLYHAPLPAWFINIQKLKPMLLSANEQMNWYPSHLKSGRFAKGIESAPDWNISRSRYWGTPMPVWRAPSGEQRIISSVSELREWAVDPTQVDELTDLHREHLDNLELWVDDRRTIKGRRIPEVFDCWVESGSMPFASRHYPFENKELFESTYPAQFVSEYIAQTRAWFYTMHVMSVGVFGQHAVENTLTTGTIMAHDGTKMSKSKKNFPDPVKVMDAYGVDSLRLYLMSSPVMKGENINFNEVEISDIRKRVLMIWWNVMSFYRLYADDNQPAVDALATPSHVMDRWILSRTATLVQLMTELLDQYDLVRASRAGVEFVADLSNWYVRTSRDRFRDPHTRPESLAVLASVLRTFSQVMAPFAPFLSDVLYQHIQQSGQSVHLSDWPSDMHQLIDQALELDMVNIRLAAEKAHAVRKTAGIKLRQPLAKLTVTHAASAPSSDLLEVLAAEINVKKVTWDSTGSELEVTLDTAITAELKAEGEARELIRTIQQLRKDHGLSMNAHATIAMPSWPAKWQATIEDKTNATLQVGSQTQLLSFT